MKAVDRDQNERVSLVRPSIVVAWTSRDGATAWPGKTAVGPADFSDRTRQYLQFWWACLYTFYWPRRGQGDRCSISYIDNCRQTPSESKSLRNNIARCPPLLQSIRESHTLRIEAPSSGTCTAPRHPRTSRRVHEIARPPSACLLRLA